MRSLNSLLGVTVLATGLIGCTVIVKEKPTTCGNGVVEGLEECDRQNFRGETCETLGFPAGHLICTSHCRIDEFNCNAYVINDGVCDDDESPEWSWDDCHSRTVSCGDGICDPSELGSCDNDCAGIECGDGWCERPAEYDGACVDCSSAAFCGDGTCQAWEREAGNCRDCGIVLCGDGFCEGDEVQTCPGDCVVLECNYDGFCDNELGETVENCADCSTGVCGDGFCNPPEDPVSCAVDCGGCGNGVCEPVFSEDSMSCAVDCENVPNCWDGTCQPPQETYLNCPSDCAISPDCGNDQIDSFESCDGPNLGNQQCEGLSSPDGVVFEGGSLTCNPDCTFNTWECGPKVIGAPCQDFSECGDGEVNVDLCLVPTAGGLCSRTCMTPGASCDAYPGARCEEIVGLGPYVPDGYYCLRPCMAAMPNSCPPGYACDGLGLFGSDYCHPDIPQQ